MFCCWHLLLIQIVSTQSLAICTALINMLSNSSLVLFLLFWSSVILSLIAVYALTLSWQRSLSYRNQFICRANHWTSSYMIGTSVMKGLMGSIIWLLMASTIWLFDATSYTESYPSFNIETVSQQTDSPVMLLQSIHSWSRSTTLFVIT